MIESPSKGVTIQSVERAVAVLGAFIEDGTPLSVSEVATRTRLAPATVHRLLTTLVRAGWLEQDHRSSRYELSVGLLGSAALALASSSLLRHGQYFLSQVSQATGLNSFVAVLRGRTSVLLARAQGREGSASDFQVGKANPLHASASGKLFLAMMSAARREEMLSALGELRRFTANTIVDPDRFRDELDHIRDVGFAVDSSELYDSYRSLAVPIRQADGSVSAALCVGGWKTPDSTAMEETLLREMIPVAEEFSRVYGQFAPW